MSKNKPRPKGDTPPPRAPEEAQPDDRTKRGRHASSEYHDAGHPGGLPELDKKTETESEHDSWGRHG